ncbi:MAG TPA: DUF2231 domain-containing protein, partial [Kofleriaceae bacterium]|nr:DUF2231 domain-containing protein [Kofleriaceae bacterium]
MHHGRGMDSKARIAGHPLHPMLVAFPLAFYTATVAALLAYLGTREAFWYRFAMVANVSGIATAVIASIPGAIDLLALPRGSRARAGRSRPGSRRSRPWRSPTRSPPSRSGTRTPRESRG